SVKVSGLGLPTLNPGAFLIVEAKGGAKNRIDVGIQFPGDGTAYPTYVGPTDADGNLEYQVQYPGKTPMQITDAPGLLIAVGVLPPGGIVPVEQLGYKVSSYSPVTAPPVVTPGLDAWVAAVEASWNTGKAVINPYDPSTWVDGSYQSNPPFGPETV